jgi:hypothetical protein
MAIQISEKFLSPRAVAALNKAPNKSQFLRDAIEYYVNRGPVNISSRIPGISDASELQSDIKDIKELLNRIVDTTSVSAAEVSVSQIENNPRKLDNHAAIKTAVNNPQPITSKEDKPATSKEPQNNKTDKHEEIERMLDESIEYLFET